MSAATPERDADAVRFGHFRILGSLGGGGMGDVYLALDEKLGRKVALKMIRSEALWSEDHKRRFHRETLAIGRLDHPNICRLYEAGEHDGRPYMALQLIEGMSLAQRLEHARRASRARGATATSGAPSTRAGITASVALIERVARALHHAHERGLVHRDVKPANIMLDSDGQPFVLDFGLVRDEQDLEASRTSSGHGVGTPLYMAPEQLRRAGHVDARTDVYSLGVTLYECLTHVRPFDAVTESDLAEKVLANRYEHPCRLNRQLPPELGLVVACALDRDQERRYRTALEMADDLRRVIDRQPVEARAIGPGLRLRRWAQRNQTLLGLGALSGIALLGVAVAIEYADAADREKRIAEARANEARANLGSYHLLADVVQLQNAIASEQTLYPAYPERAQSMRNWLREQADPLIQRLPVLEAALADLQRISSVDSEVTSVPELDDANARFLRERLTKLVADLRKFTGEWGRAASVRWRLLEAESVLERSITAYRAEWENALRAIASSDGVVASPLYRQLVLSPQIGLVPLGMDPQTELWEFAHLASGEVALRDPGTRELAIAEESGIVFVLIPGGTFDMGVQRDDPEHPNYDPAADPFESPVHSITLAPFFLSKYELTRGQWRRLTGVDQPSASFLGKGVAVTLRHPVERLDWTISDRALTRSGLCLPTEAQWEYGARAGSPPWSAGDELDRMRALALNANLASAGRVPALALVGSLRANGFGLHDTYGNVAEWCRDAQSDYGGPIQAGDGLRLGPGSDLRPFRGGSYGDSMDRFRSARRGSVAPTFPAPGLGLRPARLLTTGIQMDPDTHDSAPASTYDLNDTSRSLPR
jgi:formylglycine-generating enzyme required for sulfatase activity/tRNA A-37 threonylcarbamoyl transferase component Bud32